MRFRTIFLTLAPIALAGLPLGAPALAQDSAENAQQAQVDPFEDMWDAMLEGVDREAIMDNSMIALRNVYMEIPEFAAAEASEDEAE